VTALRQIETWPVGRATAGFALGRNNCATHGARFERYPLASVTKLVTALAVLVAAEEGIVDLDEPAGPEGSTLRHLLAHASGLPLDGQRPLGPPGSRRIYSNSAIRLAAGLVAGRAEMPFADYARLAVAEPLGLSLDTRGDPASGMHGSLDDLLALGSELLGPRLVAPETLAEATSVQFPGLAGVVPGFGRQEPNDWGLGFELRDGKSPHWTGLRNSPRTFGHFGRSGAFLWIDPDAGVACACLADREFGDWAKEAWPRLSDAVLAEAGEAA
jgi:CubicO group peptidase (beta-lactamase class C family)